MSECAGVGPGTVGGREGGAEGWGGGDPRPTLQISLASGIMSESIFSVRAPWQLELNQDSIQLSNQGHEASTREVAHKCMPIVYA